LIFSKKILKPSRKPTLYDRRKNTDINTLKRRFTANQVNIAHEKRKNTDNAFRVSETLFKKRKTETSNNVALESAVETIRPCEDNYCCDQRLQIGNSLCFEYVPEEKPLTIKQYTAVLGTSESSFSLSQSNQPVLCRCCLR